MKTIQTFLKDNYLNFYRNNILGPIFIMFMLLFSMFLCKFDAHDILVSVWSLHHSIFLWDFASIFAMFWIFISSHLMTIDIWKHRCWYFKFFFTFDGKFLNRGTHNWIKFCMSFFLLYVFFVFQLAWWWQYNRKRSPKDLIQILVRLFSSFLFSVIHLQ